METISLVRPPESRMLKSGRVILAPREEVGEHVTDKREEIVVVLKGTGILVKEGEETALKAGEAHFIAQEIRHNIRNSSDEMLEYVYVVGLFDGQAQNEDHHGHKHGHGHHSH